MTLDILLQIVWKKKITKGTRILTVTWSNSEKEEESNNDDESENFIAFMASAAEVIVLTQKAIQEGGELGFFKVMTIMIT